MKSVNMLPSVSAIAYLDPIKGDVLSIAIPTAILLSPNKIMSLYLGVII